MYVNSKTTEYIVFFLFRLTFSRLAGMIAKKAKGDRKMIIETREDLTKEIKAALKQRGLNVTGLARLLGVFQQSAARTVARSDIAVSDLLRIADAINARLDISFKDRTTEDKTQ